jgi:hypothetical protein
MKLLVPALLVAICVPLSAGCDDYQYRFFGTVDPSPTGVQQGSNGIFGSWRATSTVVRVSGGSGCPVPTASGQTQSNVPWRITVGPGSILLEQDVNGAPASRSSFSGVLNGQDFSASSTSAASSLSSCLFRGGRLTGRFSSDFSTFKASEELTWGQAGGETALLRDWVGTRADQ